ncbi:MAG: endonuclease VIII [Vallitaleaceae bacterium]|nr:endonuclease VIII [Vallitaleaceae bacterium]
MIELPEARVLAQQLKETIVGKKIINVTTQKSPHKFAWFYGDPQGYHDLLSERVVTGATHHAGMVEICTGGVNLLFGDGVNLRYYATDEKCPDKHQLDVEFEDGAHLLGSVQMYGGLWAFEEGTNDNPYYRTAKSKPSPLLDSFSEDYYDDLMRGSSDNLSLKAFLATEQRIPGLGNGVLQDILFSAKLHPKKKIKSLSEVQKRTLYESIKRTLAKMSFEGGRDTERDLFGCTGGYQTILSKKTAGQPCDVCGTLVKKEAYMGGSVYICEGCQEL